MLIDTRGVALPNSRTGDQRHLLGECGCTPHMWRLVVRGVLYGKSGYALPPYPTSRPRAMGNRQTCANRRARVASKTASCSRLVEWSRRPRLRMPAVSTNRIFRPRHCTTAKSKSTSWHRSGGSLRTGAYDKTTQAHHEDHIVDASPTLRARASPRARLGWRRVSCPPHPR
jgi:hypothetical protein